ncbi:MAG: hypothetical protein R2991_15710 [Thermoanaerobaculia bacterium]
MGTFHDDRGELHGITVVVDTGDALWVGRCDIADDTQVVLRDADVHRGEDAAGRAAYLEKAASFGVWKKHDVIAIPSAEVRSLRRLGEIAG